MASFERTLVGNTVTTDGTPVIVPIYAMPDDTASIFDALIVARDSNGNTASWKLTACAKRIDGTPTAIVGLTSTAFNTSDPGLTWSATLSTNSNDIIVTLVGDTNVTIEWSVSFDGVVTP